MRKLILKVFIFFTCLLGCCLLVLMLMQLHANKEELTRTKGFNNGMISNNENASNLVLFIVDQNIRRSVHH